MAKLDSENSLIIEFHLIKMKDLLYNIKADFCKLLLSFKNHRDHCSINLLASTFFQ